MIDYICNHLNTIHKRIFAFGGYLCEWNLGSFHQTLKICGDTWWRCRITLENICTIRRSGFRESLELGVPEN